MMLNMSSYICWDLVGSIIEFIPREYLRNFSAAHPLFHREISRVGIHIFYSNKVFKDLTAENYVII